VLKERVQWSRPGPQRAPASPGPGPRAPVSGGALV